MKRNKPAHFGIRQGHFENSRMKERSQRLRVGRYVRIRTKDEWIMGGYVGDWVRQQLEGKYGVITRTPACGHPWDYSYSWDLEARFKGTNRVGGMFGLDKEQVVVVSLRSIIQERKARERKEIAEMEQVLKSSAQFARIFENMKADLLPAIQKMAKAFKQMKVSRDQYVMVN